MHMTSKEFWSALHGMALGAAFLLLFTGAFVALLGLRRDLLTPKGECRRLRQLQVAAVLMTIFAWLAVLIGSYTIYPWYRAKLPQNTTGVVLADYPKYLLLSKPETSGWHNDGMEWKEHIAWLTPFLISAVAYVSICHGRQLLVDDKLRRTLLVLLTLAFFCASVAGIFGALINKAAPTR